MTIMKTVMILLVCILCTVFNLSAQQKFNVQNGTKTEFYDDLETAIQKAASGDTIYLPGGTISIKNSLIIDKKLAIIGIGCDIDSIGSGLQPTQIYCTVNFREGSDGSLLTGCIVNAIQFGHKSESNGLLQNIQNVTIWRNLVSSFIVLGLDRLSNNVKNIVIKENIVGNTLSFVGDISGVGASDCIINNNTCRIINDFQNSNLLNNVIQSSVSGLENCIIENNFIWSPISDFNNCLNSTFNNNAFTGNFTFPVGNNTGDNNLMGQDQDSTFKPVSSTSTSVNNIKNNNLSIKKSTKASIYIPYSFPKELEIQNTSPCKNAGTDGTDIGIFGGSTPYKKGAIPFNPHVIRFAITPQTNNNEYVNVDIQVSAQEESKDNNKIVAYEYWLNDDYDNRIRVQTSPQQIFTLLDSVNCSSVSKINNTLSYRFLDDDGLWSSTITTNFFYDHPVTISLNFTYTKSALQGETPTVEYGYSYYSKVEFNLYNITKGQFITDFTYQYPDMVINQQISAGDSISIIAIDRNFADNFESITKTIVINDINTSVTFNIVQRGFIQSSYQDSENEANVGILYDSIGHRIAQYDYINRTLTTGELADGTYQLLTMAKSPFFNTIPNLSDLDSTELVPNTHYILQALEVKRGIITKINIPTIPKLDENQLIYTTNNTLFSVNKSTIAIDNFVTLRGAIEFKEEYRGQIGNLKLIVDIPDSCSFFDKSVMIGNSVFSGYLLQNNQLIIPLATDSDIVHFCITPAQAGNYAPNGFIEFTLNGKTIRQPIGAANFEVEGLSIFVPSITAQKTIPVRGITTAKSLIKIYDDNELIGQTVALADGNWKTSCNLYEPIGYSYHNIHAEIITPKGKILQTETKEVFYDETDIEVYRVIMYNTSHRFNSFLTSEVTEFDFLNPPTKGAIYWYWPSYPDFTFTIEFTKNNTTVVSNVNLYVLTSSKAIVNLPVIYNPAKGLWVATGKFDSNSLPINTYVDFDQNFARSDVLLKSASDYQVPWNEIKTFCYIMSECRRFYQKFKECNDNDNTFDNRMDHIVKNYIDYTHNDIIGVDDNIYGKTEDHPSSHNCQGAYLLASFIRSSFTPDLEEWNNFSIAPRQKDILDEIQQLLALIQDLPCSCPPPPGDGYGGDGSAFGSVGGGSRNPNANPIHDPSGFVYEAVPSNRLQGVTATIYHKTNEADEGVVWDAADYEQENPLITNDYGEYAWDVPQDLWQVKYEKEGYETAYSAWLPVPPPQLNINIAMVNAVPPFVKEAKGYEEGIEVAFSKFMLPATMTTDFISVTRNGANETGKITLLDAEENPANTGESFVSKVRFVPQIPFLMTDEVILTVDSMVLSYAGRNMTDDFVQKIEIQKEVKSLTATPVLNVAINGKGYIEVTAEPFDAAAGKTITARSVSSALATVTGTAVLDKDGKARLQVGGELPGSTQIIITLDSTDMRTTVGVNIAMELAEPEQEQVKPPVASIPTGSTVEKNTEISLSSGTEGATIYYTTDGSTPSGLTGLEYTQPIVLTKDVVLQAIATKEGMLDSEIAVFEYTVDAGMGIDQPNQPVTLFVHNQTLIVRGFELGEQYTVYSVLGNIVIQGKITNKVEQWIPLPNKGIFIISTSRVKAKILAE